MNQRLLSIFTLGVLLLIGCSKKPMTANIAGWEHFQDPYFKVQFTIPQGWQKVTEGTKVSFYTSQDALQKFYDPTAQEGKDGAQLSVKYEKLDTLKPLETYMNNLKNDLTASGYTVQSVEPSEIEDAPASRIMYSGRFDEKNKISVIRTLAIKDSMMYTVSYEAFNDFFEPYKVVVDSFFASVELPKPKAAPVNPAIPSTEFETFSNSFLDISYPNNFEPSSPPPSGEVQFMLQIQGYRQDSNILIDVRPAKKLTVDKVVEQNEKMFKVTSRGETKIDGLKAIYLNYSPAREIGRRVYFVVKNDKVYRIILTYYQPARKDFLPAFEKAVASIRIK
jgi:hypothetical protein